MKNLSPVQTLIVGLVLYLLSRIFNVGGVVFELGGIIISVIGLAEIIRIRGKLKSEKSSYLRIIVFGLLTFGILYFWNTKTKQNVIPSSNNVVNESVTPTTGKNITDTLLDVLDALSFYNLSTETLNSDDISSMMSGLIDAKKYMIRGDGFVLRYELNPNEYISVTSRGMVAGSKMVQQSTDNLIQYLKKVDDTDLSTYSDLKYQTAKYLSDNKEGFMLIAQSAPQMTALLWEPAKGDNPTGPIPYTISVADRQKVLKKIDTLFGNYLEEYYSSKDNFNSMIFAVDSIKKNIEPDTYEQSRLLK